MANKKLYDEMCRFADSGQDKWFRRGRFMSSDEMSARMGCDFTGPTLMAMVHMGWLLIQKPEPGSHIRVNSYAIPETFETQLFQKMDEMKSLLTRNLPVERAGELAEAEDNYKKRMAQLEKEYVLHINSINEKFDKLDELKASAKEAFKNITE